MPNYLNCRAIDLNIYMFILIVLGGTTINPHYLLLKHPVHLHPPQGLISMRRNLLKKYQTSPDMLHN